MKPCKFYSYSWGFKVVGQFVNILGRATAQFMAYTGITLNQIVTLVCKYPQRWNNFKKTIKILNNFINCPKFKEKIETEEFKTYFLNYVKRLGLYNPKNVTENRFSVLDSSNNLALDL